MTASNTQKISGSVIAFGACTPSLLEDRLHRLSASPERLIIIDPLFEPPPSAAQESLGEATVQIIDAVLASEDGEAEMILYSFPGLNSLHAPTIELMTIFPGLRERRRQPVRTISPETLRQHVVGLPAPLHIWIDTPGAEAAILNALEAAQALEQTETLELRCGSAAFFTDAQDRVALETWLAKRQFRLVAADETDPDWPELRFQADLSARRITQLETRLDALSRDHETALAKLKSDLEARDKTLAERDAALTDAEARLQAKDATHTEQAAQIEKANKARAELKKELEARDKTLAERDAALKDAEARLQAKDAIHTEQAAQIEKANKEISALETDFKAKTQTLGQRDATIGQLRQQIETGTELANRAKADLDAARQDLRLALSTQASLQTNLDDLRQRYRHLHEEKARQDDLLEQLTPRLREAAQQLRAASLPGPEKAEKKAIKSAPKTRRSTKSKSKSSK